ncbi:S1C family serine protease [Zavarzinella formosa]|uniref:S1C family serine protease n=1 Tax=Zavarzinella formosa TaxID=360055 RepID=UPI0002E68005|nr:trypsin-like peptidase domain-containing protein [Zavarzinella formosa]
MSRRRVLALAASLLIGNATFADPVNKTIPDPPPIVYKISPETIEELKSFQTQTKAVIEKVIPCTVCLRVGSASGSGVIVSKDGLVLTAGHVSGAPGQTISIVLHDGRIVKGKTLGVNRAIDSGMAQITDPGPWPYVEMGDFKDLKTNQWSIAIGHPGGFKQGRTPVVRVGKLSIVNDRVLQTDNALVGGDSGGPLFDMKGRVIGIHSRIGNFIVNNMHVPIGTFRDTWDQLVKGDTIGESDVYLGVSADPDAKDCKLASVTPNAPAAKAGLLGGDVILKFSGKDVKTYEEMKKFLYLEKPGNEVTLLVKRGDENKEIKVKLGKRE